MLVGELLPVLDGSSFSLREGDVCDIIDTVGMSNKFCILGELHE